MKRARCIYPLSSKQLLSCLVLAVAGLPAMACSTAGSLTITNFPTDGGYTFQVTALNALGQLTGYFYVPGGSPDAFLYSNGAVTDLGTLGGPLSEGLAINSSGQVAGASYLSDFEFHPFLSTSNGLMDLGTLGGTFAMPSAVNDAGQVAGGSFTAGNLALRGFLYSGGSIVSVGSLGGDYSYAFALNGSGTVVGESALLSGDIHAFAYAAGVITDLGTLGGSYSSAFAVNDSGVVVGQSTLPSGATHGFVYSAGVMNDLGTLGGTNSTSVTVNSAGQIIGAANITGDAESHAVLYFNGVLTDLGTLGGNVSYPYAINSTGQVVGYSSLADGTVHAVLWHQGQMVDLNTLLPAGSGWVLNIAQFINDAGRIVGTGTLNGVSQPFILDLAPANQPPVAVAGADQVVECPGQVTLDGSASSDPDGDALGFQWTFNGTVLGTTATLTVSLPLGANVVTLQVTDPCGATAQANVTVSVVDTTPPVFSVLADSTASAGPNGTAAVPDLISHLGATDACAGNAVVLAQDPAPGTLVGLGAHTITVTATDPSGNMASGRSTFTVLDTTPPAIQTLAATPNILSPPNHRLVPVTVSVSAADNCDAAPVSQIVSVFADGPTAPGDIQITGPLTVNLEASKNVTGTTRVYTIVVQTTDAAGNSSQGTVTVTVPSGTVTGGKRP